MSLTTEDKQFITTALKGESSRLEAKITSEVTRLEVLIEDGRADNERNFELISGGMLAKATIKDHARRLTNLEQDHSMYASTLTTHSKQIQKLEKSDVR